MKDLIFPPLACAWSIIFIAIIWSEACNMAISLYKNFSDSYLHLLSCINYPWLVYECYIKTKTICFFFYYHFFASGSLWKGVKNEPSKDRIQSRYATYSLRVTFEKKNIKSKKSDNEKIFQAFSFRNDL